MSLLALDDVVAHTGTAGPLEGVIRIEALLPEKTTLDLHGEDAVGVPA